jgi:hypothetical protein
MPEKHEFAFVIGVENTLPGAGGMPLDPGQHPALPLNG